MKSESGTDMDWLVLKVSLLTDFLAYVICCFYRFLKSLHWEQRPEWKQLGQTLESHSVQSTTGIECLSAWQGLAL